MVADDLGIVGSGQSLLEEDQDKIDSRFDGLVTELQLRGIVTVNDDEAIPAEWCGPLAELLANECAPTFGVPKKSPAEILIIEDRIKTMVMRMDASNRFLQFESTLLYPRRQTYRSWQGGW